MCSAFVFGKVARLALGCLYLKKYITSLPFLQAFIPMYCHYGWAIYPDSVIYLNLYSPCCFLKKCQYDSVYQRLIVAEKISMNDAMSTQMHFYFEIRLF